MKIVGSSKQDGIPSPDNPVEIKNETVLIITDKEGNKKEMPFKYEKILKEGDKIEKINGEWCLVRRKPMNEEKIINILTDDIVALNVGYEKYEEAVQGLLDLYEQEKARNKNLEQIEKEHKKENGRLREEIDKKDKIINLIGEMLEKDHEWFYSEFDNYTKQDFIDYFTNKVEESD